MGRIVRLTDRDRDAVLELVREAHGETTARRQEILWNWRISENPSYLPDEDYRLGYEVDGQVKGTIAIIPAKVKIGATVMDCSCPLDLVISPSVKQRSFAGGALMIGREVARRSTPVIYGSTDDRNVKLWGRVFECEPVIGRYRCYYHELSLAPQLARRGIPGWAAGALGVAHRLLGGANRLLLALRSPGDVTIKPVREFDAEFDGLWQWASTSYPNALVRDRAFLDWRFGHVPGRDHRVLGAYRSGKLVGYAVLRPIDEETHRTARVVDIFTHREEVGVFRRLLGAILTEAKSLGAARVSMLEMFQPGFRREMALALFFLGQWTVNINGRCHGRPPEDFYDANKWWITFADSDLDLAL